MRTAGSVFFTAIRMFTIIFVVLVMALVVALSQVNLDSLRSGIVTVLQDATGLPVQINGAVSWKLSLQPQIELNSVCVENASWAKSKCAYSADKIDVRLNLVSLFRNKPTIHNIKLYNVKIDIEENKQGEYSAPKFQAFETTDVAVGQNEKYPFKDMGFGGVEIKNLDAKILKKRYQLAGFNIRMNEKKDTREYSGWLKINKDVLPFIISMSEYNPERKIYPLQMAISTGGDALIANVALEGTSRLPIDFIIKGDLPDMTMIGDFYDVDLSQIKNISVNIAGGFDRKKLILRKSDIVIRNTKIGFSGDYDWAKEKDVINLNVSSKKLNLQDVFPNLYGRYIIIKNRKLNVFKDIPLFGKAFVDKTINLNLNLDRFIMYRDLDIQNMHLQLKAQNNHVRIDSDLSFAKGDIDFAIDADVDKDGHIWSTVAFAGQNVQVGNILQEVHINDFLSEMPVNIDVFVQANGKNLSDIMATVSGPVQVYAVGAGYAHSALVSYVYGADFLTSLRHSIEDLFSSEKKHNQIKVSCMALNAKLRNGVFDSQNGFAIETNAINIRLAGNLNLGEEEMNLSLTTVPVRGLKLSLTGNVVNSVALKGDLAQPDINISGASVAGKVASATGLGLLLAPLTGGISLVAGAGIGLVAGDLLENWLADDKPCKTAMEEGAPVYDDDPEWFSVPVADLIQGMLAR